MTLDLTNLKRGDILICRDVTRRTSMKYGEQTNWIYATSHRHPTAWYSGGQSRPDMESSPYDIVHVITAKKPKEDSRVTFLLKLADKIQARLKNGLAPMVMTSGEARRLRAIAGRLRKGGK